MTSSIIQNLKLAFFVIPENNFKARLLRGDFLFRVVLVFFILRIIVLPLYVHFPKSVFFAEIVSSDIFELLNKQRDSQGLASLREDPKLKQAAFFKAQDMIEHDYFGHQSPTGVSGWHWIQKSGYNYEMAGENLAIGFLDSEEVHQAWDNSSLHKRNLLSPYFQDVGIAVLTGEFQGNETTIVVQLFAKPELSIPEKIIPPVEAKIEEPIVQTEPPESEMKEKPEEIVSPEEIAPEVAVSIEKEETSFQSEFWQFLVKKYSDFLQKMIFFIALAMTLIFILNIIAIIQLTLPVKEKWLILRKFASFVFLAIIVLVLLGLLDKSLIIQFIPHHLKI